VTKTIWEYRIQGWEPMSKLSPSLPDLLDSLGREGWELVHVSASLQTYIFKRPKDVENVRQISKEEMLKQ
jgi:hypothetical protein